VSANVEQKIAAMREHVTQLAADHFFLALTADDWREFMPNEEFTLSDSRVPVRIPEDDLFAGLPAED
jgi:mycothiol S-conjugate amidase